jgi:hypothetical protein
MRRVACRAWLAGAPDQSYQPLLAAVPYVTMNSSQALCIIIFAKPFSMARISYKKRLVIFCDGTWCGRETGTESNIKVLAGTIGRVRFADDPSHVTAVHAIEPFQEDVIAGYQEGVGLNRTFLEYLWDGGTASTIGEECVSVYKFIVDHYTDDYEIWMFGLSRGAFILRCVAGMINNCGIFRKEHRDNPPLTDEEVFTLSREVYRTYRSPLDVDKPKSFRCRALRDDASRVWLEKRPIRLMCILDTVGSLGIPRINAGIGFDWPEFYDQRISTVVQEVYHAPSIHDRLWIFQPCLAYNGPGEAEVKIHQTWLPGCHYDIGRQRFRFMRKSPNLIERLFGLIPDRLGKTIYPNEVLADVALRWMLQAVQTTEAADDRMSSLIPDITMCISSLTTAIADPISSQPTGPTGSGDIYGNVLEYGPAGSLFGAIRRLGAAAVSLLNRIFPRLGDSIQDILGIKVIIRILTATQDRRIPARSEGTDASDGPSVFPYKDIEGLRTEDGGEVLFSVEQTARLSETGGVDGGLRYPSRTYETLQLWNRVFDA